MVMDSTILTTSGIKLAMTSRQVERHKACHIEKYVRQPQKKVA